MEGISVKLSSARIVAISMFFKRLITAQNFRPYEVMVWRNTPELQTHTALNPSSPLKGMSDTK